MRATRTTAVLGILLASLVTAAPAAEAVTTKTVAMTSSNTFFPKTVTVTRGTIVKWTNKSFFSTHTSTSNTGLWNSGRVAPGASYSRTFKRSGTYRYHCSFHSGMTGKVVVS